MRWVISHTTSIDFPAPVREHQCELRLAPRESAHQRRLSMDVRVDPVAPFEPYVDGFGNLVHAFSILAPHDYLVTELDAEVETELTNPFDYRAVAPARESEWIRERMDADPRLWDFVLHKSAFTPDLRRVDHGMDLPAPAPGQPLIDAVQAAVRWIGETLAYTPGASEVDTPLDAVLRERAGVCQDFAHLLVSIVRGWGVPARYVMGYVALDEDDVPEGAPPQATHAWADVLIPGAGWRGFDAVHQLVANDRYIPVALGRDYKDATPQRGTFQGEHPGTPPAVHVQLRCQQ